MLKACAIAGDEATLASQLRVPVGLVVDWLLGRRPLPPDVFLRAVDIVLLANQLHIQATRDFLEAAKARQRRRTD